jgi:hypothetical protein
LRTGADLGRADLRRLVAAERLDVDGVLGGQVLGGTSCDSRAAFIAAYLTGATTGRTP